MGQEQMKNRTSSFLVQGSILAIASIISRLIGMVYRIPLNNIIGNDGMGIYGRAYKVYNICLILSCYSIPTAVSRLVAEKMERKEHRNAYRVFLCAMAFGIVIGGIVSVFLYFSADYFAMLLFKNPKCALPMRVLAPNILIFAMMGVLRGYFQGKNTMLPTSISQVIEQVVNAIVSVVAAYLFMNAHNLSVNISAYGASGGTLGTVLGALTGLLFLAFVFTIYYPMLKKQMKRDRSSEIDTYTQTLKMILMTIFPIILSQAVYQISGFLNNILYDNIMNGKGIDASQRDVLTGIYSNQYELLTNVPIAIATAIGVAIVPSIVASMTRQDYREVKKKIFASIKFNMIIAIPSAIGLAILAKPIIQMLFYKNTVENTNLSATILQFGSIAVVFVALSTTTNAILQSLKRLRVPVYHSAIALGVNLVVVFILLKFTGAGLYALVIGYILFAMVVSGLNWYYIGKTLHYKQEVIYSFVIPFMASVLMGVVTFLSYHGVHKLTHHNWISILISLILSVIVYVALLLVLRVFKEKELRNLPKGEKIIAILKRFKLL